MQAVRRDGVTREAGDHRRRTQLNWVVKTCSEVLAPLRKVDLGFPIPDPRSPSCSRCRGDRAGIHQYTSRASAPKSVQYCIPNANLHASAVALALEPGTPVHRSFSGGGWDLGPGTWNLGPGTPFSVRLCFSRARLSVSPTAAAPQPNHDRGPGTLLVLKLLFLSAPPCLSLPHSAFRAPRSNDRGRL